MSFTLMQLAEHADAQIVGDASCTISAFNSLPDAGQGDITFINDNRYKKHLEQTQASAVILTKNHLPYCPTNALVTDDPYLAYAKVMQLIYEKDTLFNYEIAASAIIGTQCNICLAVYIGANAVIGDRVSIEEGCHIGPGCIIGNDVSIGSGSRLAAGVTLCEGVKIGRATVIHPGAVIGSDGFGMAHDKNGWVKIPQIGFVVVGDEVEIGANTTIDRGALGDTIIEDGVKIDNQVQIGHNVKIGASTAIAGCTGIAGSTVIGKRCRIGGAVAIIGHIHIADDVAITGGSMIRNSIKQAGIYSSGMTVSDHKTWRKNIIRFKQLDTIARRLDQLDKKH